MTTDVLTKIEVNGCVCMCVSCPGCIPDPGLLTAGVNLSELELEQRMGGVEHTDGLCSVD